MGSLQIDFLEAVSVRPEEINAENDGSGALGLVIDQVWLVKNRLYYDACNWYIYIYVYIWGGHTGHNKVQLKIATHRMC